MKYEIDPKNLVFTDNEAQRSVTSDIFNFILDKDSGISICWGEDINDTPEYDPITPQELVFKLNKNFDLKEMLNQFNFLGNIRIKNSDTEFQIIEDGITELNNENLICLGTLGSVVLIFDSSLNEIKINDLLTFTNYIKKFKVAVIIQINVKESLTMEELTKLKLLGTSIQIKNENWLSAEAFAKNIKQLEDNGILVSSKLTINNETYDEAMKLIDLLPAKTSMKVIFTLPYITAAKYVKIQQKFIDAKLENVRIATCAFSRFNKRKQNNIMLHMNCDAGCFSVYIEDGIIYQCEMSKANGIAIKDCKTIHDFWNHKNMVKARKQIIENNYCKLASQG
jgi:hypothetical protein